MTMKCPACGKENVESAKFCKKCGAYLAWAPTTAAQASEFPATQMAPDSVEPDSDATVIRPVTRPAARPASAPAAPDPLLEALADRGGPGVGAMPGAGPSVTPHQSASPSPGSVRSQAVVAPGQDVPARSGKAGLIVGGLALIALLLAALAYWWLSRPTTTEPARPAVVAPAAPTEPLVAPPSPIQSPPPPVAKPVPTAPPVPLAQPAAEPAPAVQAPKAVVTPRPKPVPKAKPAPVQETPRPSVAPPTPTPAPAPAPVAAPAPAVPAGPSSPAQACEGKSFFGKPACMNEQCGTPRFTNHAQCVELREQNRRREEQQQRN